MSGEARERQSIGRNETFKASTDRDVMRRKIAELCQQVEKDMLGDVGWNI